MNAREMVRHLPFLFLARKESAGNVMFILESERLILRAPRPSDIAAMTVWLGDYDVSKNMSRVPHPYGEADAEAFVGGTGPRREGRHHVFSVVRRKDAMFMGGIGL